MAGRPFFKWLRYGSEVAVSAAAQKQEKQQASVVAKSIGAQSTVAAASIVAIVQERQ